MIAVLLFSTAIPTRGLAFQNAALNRSSQGQTGWNHRPRATSRQVLNMNISRTGYKVAPSISFLENFFTCQPAPSVFNSTCSVKREFCSFRCVIFRQVALFEQVINQVQAWIIVYGYRYQIPTWYKNSFGYTILGRYYNIHKHKCDFLSRESTLK